jgi:hypothetical protein
MVCVNFIYKRKLTSGLNRDAQVFKNAIESVYNSVDFKFIDFKHDKIRPADIDIYLEHIQPWVKDAKAHTIWMVNHEFIYDYDIELATYVDTIVCKSALAKKLLQDNYPDLRDKIVNTGWYTPINVDYQTKPLYDRDINLAVHFAGNSFLKNTIGLLHAWSNIETNIDLLVSFDYRNTFNTKIKKHMQKYMSDNKKYFKVVNNFHGHAIKCYKKNTLYVTTTAIPEEIYNKLLQKAFWFIMPSLTEGYGHSLNQARSMGQIVFTTDAPPINEYFNKKNSFLVKPRITKKGKGFINDWLDEKINAQINIVSVKDMSKALVKMFKLPRRQLENISQNAIKSASGDKEECEQKLIDLFNNIKK